MWQQCCRLQSGALTLRTGWMLVQQEGTEHTRAQRGVFRLECMRSHGPDGTAWVRKSTRKQSKAWKRLTFQKDHQQLGTDRHRQPVDRLCYSKRGWGRKWRQENGAKTQGKFQKQSPTSRRNKGNMFRLILQAWLLKISAHHWDQRLAFINTSYRLHTHTHWIKRSRHI